MFGKVSTCLLAAPSRTRRATDSHVLLYHMSDHQEEIFVDNRYALKKAWKYMWGHPIRGKFAFCLNLFVAPVYNLTQFTMPLAPI
jgi:hypothetical protein